MMSNLTTLEAAYINTILNSEFMDEADSPVGHEVWTCTLSFPMKPAQAGGVASSLKQKGYIDVAGKGDDATTWVTSAGLDAFHSKSEPNKPKTAYAEGYAAYIAAPSDGNVSCPYGDSPFANIDAAMWHDGWEDAADDDCE